MPHLKKKQKLTHVRTMNYENYVRKKMIEMRHNNLQPIYMRAITIVNPSRTVNMQCGLLC